MMGDFRASFSTSMSRYGAAYIEDMHFLARDVWPRVQRVAYCHDSYSCRRYPSSHPFPVRRHGSEHLGEVYDQLSVGRQGDIGILLKAPVNWDCVPSTAERSAATTASATAANTPPAAGLEMFGPPVDRADRRLVNNPLRNVTRSL